MRTNLEVEEGIGMAELRIIQARRNQRESLIENASTEAKDKIVERYHQARVALHQYRIQERAEHLAYRLSPYVRNAHISEHIRILRIVRDTSYL